MKITLAEIARLSGVSKTTASFVLNGKQTSIGISPETVEKVQKVISSLNYKKDKNAAALAAAKKTKTKILLLSPWLNNVNSFFMNEVMRGISEFRTDFALDYDIYQPGELANNMGKTKKTDASDWILITGTSRKDEKYLESSCFKGKVIVLNRKLEGITSFSVDNFAAGKNLAARCCASGYYEDFIIFAPPDDERTNALRQRIEGMTSALKEQKVQPCIIPPENDDAVIKALRKSGKKVMIFAQIDIQAARWISLLTKNGFRVPDHVGISGFDHEPISEIMTPSITTVESKTYEITCSALEKIAGKTVTPGKEYIFRPEIIFRESTR